ncbi:Cyclic nucleotide-gated cation channel beta-1, partial [Ophiophagus hannah]
EEEKKIGREEVREEGKKKGREEGREGGREERRKGGREEKRKGGKEEKVGREERRERGRFFLGGRWQGEISAASLEVTPMLARDASFLGCPWWDCGSRQARPESWGPFVALEGLLGAEEAAPFPAESHQAGGTPPPPQVFHPGRPKAPFIPQRPIMGVVVHQVPGVAVVGPRTPRPPPP